MASSLVNTGQQVGGAIGLAVLGTVAWTVVANTVRSLAPAAHTAAAKAAVYNHALATGFSRGFLVSAGIAVIALIITLVMVRVTKEDLAGVQSPMMG